MTKSKKLSKTNDCNKCEYLKKNYCKSLKTNIPKDKMISPTPCPCSKLIASVQIPTEKKKNVGICILCEKPVKNMKKKGELCQSCMIKRNKLKDFFTKEIGSKYPPSNTELVYLKKQYNLSDVFSYLQKNPQIHYDYLSVPKNERRTIKKELKEEYRSDKYMKEDFIKYESNIPQYIFDAFKKNINFNLLTISGEKEDPFVYCTCKKCGKEERYKYSIFKTIRRHTCDIKKSSGETVIEDYLKIKKIKYKTQGNTLKCKNPETKHNLPYDFELTDYKIIIEVQGEQHREFVEYFHGTYDNFEYQLRKDKYKKDNAIKHGYQYIELFYSEIKDGLYRQIIEDAINERIKP